MNKTKRIISLLLSFILVLGMIPSVPVLAASPNITTEAASNVGYYEATVSAYVATNGSNFFKEHGFYYGTTSSCKTKVVVDDNGGTGTSIDTPARYKYTFDDLDVGTKYYYKAYVLTTTGTYYYGGVGNFVTDDDNVNPSINPISSSAGTSFDYGTSTTFSTKASDNMELDEIEMFIDSESVKTITTNAAAGVSKSISYTTDELEAGTHTVTVKAWDAAGNMNQTSIKVTVNQKGDSTNPVINKITSSAGTSFNYGTSTTFSTKASDNVELDKIQMFIDGESVKTITTNAAAGVSKSISYTTDELEVGTHTVTVKAWDVAGNANQTAITVTVNKRAQLSAPQLTNNSITADTGKTVTVTWSSVANATAYNVYIWNAQGTEVFRSIEQSALKYSCTFEKEGTYYVQIYALSSAFESSPSGDATIVVENPLSEVTLLGDINSDGSVTNLDRFVLNRWLAKTNGYTINAKNADIDGDGSVTENDCTILTRYLAMWPGYETLSAYHQESQTPAVTDTSKWKMSYSSNGVNIDVSLKSGTPDSGKAYLFIAEDAAGLHYFSTIPAGKSSASFSLKNLGMARGAFYRYYVVPSGVALVDANKTQYSIGSGYAPLYTGNMITSVKSNGQSVSNGGSVREGEPLSITWVGSTGVNYFDLKVTLDGTVIYHNDDNKGKPFGHSGSATVVISGDKIKPGKLVITGTVAAPSGSGLNDAVSTWSGSVIDSPTLKSHKLAFSSRYYNAQLGWLFISPDDKKVTIGITDETSGKTYTQGELNSQYAIECEIADSKDANTYGFKFVSGESGSYVIVENNVPMFGLIAHIVLKNKHTGETEDRVEVCLSTTYRKGIAGVDSYTSPHVKLDSLKNVTKKHGYGLRYESDDHVEIYNVQYKLHPQKTKQFPEGYYTVTFEALNSTYTNYGVAAYNSEFKQVGSTQIIAAYSPTTPLCMVAYEGGKAVLDILTLNWEESIREFKSQKTYISIDVPADGYFAFTCGAEDLAVQTANFTDVVLALIEFGTDITGFFVGPLSVDHSFIDKQTFALYLSKTLGSEFMEDLLESIRNDGLEAAYTYLQNSEEYDSIIDAIKKSIVPDSVLSGVKQYGTVLASTVEKGVMFLNPGAHIAESTVNTLTTIEQAANLLKNWHNSDLLYIKWVFMPNLTQ